MLRTAMSACVASAGVRLLSACLLAALVCMPSRATAQSSAGGPSSTMFSNLANPAIGMNALFTGQAAPTLNEPYGLHFDQADLSFISVVDPHWTLNANITFVRDGTVDPEEIWVRNTNLPAVQLKLGKLRATFGRHGLLHTHAFPFVQAPIVMPNTIGEEGFKASGLEAAWLTPLPWYAELTGGVYEALPADAENPLDFGSSRHDNVPYLGHFKNQLDLNDETTAELGFSTLQGRGSDGHRHGSYGGDLTFRNVPARNSNRRGWILQGEYLQKGSVAGSDWIREQDGGYGSFQYRLSQVWWLGVRGEHARNSFTDFVVDEAGVGIPAHVTRGSVNVAWTPSEFSYVRLEYSHGKADRGVHPTDDRIMIQMSYTIGYHPAHAY